MSAKELRKKFLEFFESRGHKIVPSSSLIPDDPSVLLTTAGMQQFKPYFLGKADPTRDFGSKRVASIQKAFRTSDIDEVGDESHLTFFEMLGHFSFGDYFKKETIEWTYEFLTEVLKIPKERISATVFAGDEKIPFDKESYDAWSKFLPPERIRKGPRADNVWGPAGPEGPCGAANEIYVDNLEVATLVFMEYFCAKDQSLTPLPQNGVDVGWGFERLVMIVQGKKNIFETDILNKIIKTIEKESGASYDRADEESKRMFRIIADHTRATVFLAADGIYPGTSERNYIVRRLLRRATLFADTLAIPAGTFSKIISVIIEEYKEIYGELKKEQNIIEEVIWQEEQEFKKTIARGMREFEKLPPKNGVLSGTDAFILKTTYGFPIELIQEIAKRQYGAIVDMDVFNKEFKKHQEISRAGQEKKFGGHGLLLDTGELKAKDEAELKKVTRLHTATHLLQAALRKVLGEEVKQMGSDITAERTRFDFSFSRKLTPEEIKKVEEAVNGAISEKMEVKMQEMNIEDAKKSGALFFFREKYPSRVKVYSVGPSTGSGRSDSEESSDSKRSPFSRELCGGPHVKNIAEVGKFVIVKEEAVASGVRRIRAQVMP